MFLHVFDDDGMNDVCDEQDDYDKNVPNDNNPVVYRNTHTDSTVAADDNGDY